MEVGNTLASTLKGGDIVALRGELGAGKTTLMKGIAEFFGIDPKDVVSPTFTLMQEYKIKRSKDQKITRLIHIDTYRLKSEDELVEIGVEDYLGEPETVCVIEWPEKMMGLLGVEKYGNIVDINIYDEYGKRNIRVN